MDKDRAKGKLTDMGGRLKRQTGEWTGDKDLQAEGAGEQVKGKTQNVVGKVKDAGRDAVRNIRDKDKETVHEDRPRKRRVA
jgi:uncharacterized protein YjbJ (UPF0337 family)